MRADMVDEKRVKTGGRPPKKSTLELIEDAKLRSEIARLDDDTTLPAELAALYLCISMSQLAIFHKELGGDGGRKDGPAMIKHIEKGAVGQNQPVYYKLGALRAWEKQNTASTSFEAMKNAGMLGWVSTQAPFFTKTQPAGRKKSLTVLECAWNTASPHREERFKGLVEGAVGLEWMTPAQAAASRWKDVAEHKEFAALWLRLLRNEIEATGAAVEATDIGQDIADAPPPIAASTKRSV